MTAPVEHVLQILRSHLPTNVSRLSKKEPLAFTVPQLFVPLMRELVDDSQSRRRLAQAPAFPCKLKRVTVTTTTRSANANSALSAIFGTSTTPDRSSVSVSVDNETNVALWSAVLPWETSLGLSHVNLNSFKSPTSSIEQQKEEKEENKSLQEIPRGMLFVSRGIEHANADLRGKFVPWIANQSFWSGAIRQQIDVLFLQGKQPLPKEVTFARRKEGELAAVLSDKFRNGYGCKAEHVQQLDPFPQFDIHSQQQLQQQEEGKSTEKKKQQQSLSETVYDMMFDSSLSSKSYSVLCPKSKHAPFFVLELPGGFTKEKVIQNENDKSSSSSTKTTYVELELGKEMCQDIDTKMLIERNFIPTLREATNTTLQRMCREVLQRGAKYILEEAESQRRNEDEKLGFGKDEKERNTKPIVQHVWSDVDTEFLCLSTRLALGDYELNGTTWDVLADYIQRFDSKAASVEEEEQEEEQSKSEHNNEQAVSPFFKQNPQSFEMIWTLMNDGSVFLPNSISGVVMQELESRRLA